SAGTCSPRRARSDRSVPRAPPSRAIANRRSARPWHRRRHSAHRRCYNPDKKRARAKQNPPPPSPGKTKDPPVPGKPGVRSPRDAQRQPSPRSNAGSRPGLHWDHSADQRRLEPTWRLKGKLFAPAQDRREGRSGSFTSERMGPVLDREGSALLDHDFMGRDRRRRLGGLHGAYNLRPRERGNRPDGGSRGNDHYCDEKNALAHRFTLSTLITSP